MLKAIVVFVGIFIILTGRSLLRSSDSRANDVLAVKRMRRLIEEGYFDDAPDQRYRRARRLQIYMDILATMTLTLSALMLIFGLAEATKFQPDGQWPRVAGQVVDTRVVRVSSRSSTTYLVKGNYAYTVDGHSYQREWTVDRARTRELAEAAAPSYIGRTDLVWYDPLRPARSSLNAVSWELPISLLVGGGIALVFGLGLLSFTISLRRTVSGKRKQKQSLGMYA